MDDTRNVFSDSRATPPSLPAGVSDGGPDGEPPYDEEPQAVPGSFLAALPQFFVFPAILVATLTAVYLLLRMLAGAEPADASELLADLSRAGPHERWQVLYTLSDGLKPDRDGNARLHLDEVPVADLSALYERLTALEATPAEASLMRQHLLLVLAHKHDPGLTHYALQALEDGDAELRKGALQALALMGDPAALPALAPRLTGKDADERLLALGALASLHDPAADELVAGQFLAEDTIVARNAVLLRARAGDARAAPFLGRLLDRATYTDDGRLDGDVPSMTDASREVSRSGVIEAFLIEAARSAGALGDPALAGPLQKLRETDASLKVRSAAIDALHAIDERS